MRFYECKRMRKTSSVPRQPHCPSLVLAINPPRTVGFFNCNHYDRGEKTSQQLSPESHQNFSCAESSGPPTPPLGPLGVCVAEASAQPGWTALSPGRRLSPSAPVGDRGPLRRAEDAVPRQLPPDFKHFHVNPQMLILFLCWSVSASRARDKGLVGLGGDPRKQE